MNLGLKSSFNNELRVFLKLLVSFQPTLKAFEAYAITHTHTLYSWVRKLSVKLGLDLKLFIKTL